jgi:4-hydroxy-tetrahydrodipicolinate synthase
MFYSDPFIDNHNQMKEALVILKQQKTAYVRPRFMKLSDREIGRVRQGLIEAGLLTR